MQGLADRLTRLGYTALFLRLRREADALWAEPGAPAALAALAADAAAPAEARFLAAELLAAQGQAMPDATLAAAYAEALRATRVANVWGMPGQLDTPPARHLMGFGAAAVMALRPLLDDGRRLTYSGSEDATEANAAGWRVQDIAASMIAAIRGDAFHAAATPVERDAARALIAASQ